MRSDEIPDWIKMLHNTTKFIIMMKTTLNVNGKYF